MSEKKNASHSFTISRMEGYLASAKNNNPYIPDVPKLVGCNNCFNRYKATAAFDDVLTPISADVGDIDNFFTNLRQTRAAIFASASASHGNTIANNEGIDNFFSNSGQTHLSIFSTTSAFKTKTYKKHTSWKAKAYIFQDKAMIDTHDENKAAD